MARYKDAEVRKYIKKDRDGLPLMEHSSRLRTHSMKRIAEIPSIWPWLLLGAGPAVIGLTIASCGSGAATATPTPTKTPRPAGGQATATPPADPDGARPSRRPPTASPINARPLRLRHPARRPRQLRQPPLRPRLRRPPPPNHRRHPLPPVARWTRPTIGVQAFLWWRPEVADRDLNLVKEAGFPG